MSELEGLSKPVLLPLIEGKAATLAPNDQETIARWGVKTVMVIEGTKPQDVPKFFEAATRESFVKDNRLPEHTMIWIGKSVESGLFSNGANFEFAVNETGSKGGGAVTTMVVGHLVIQLLAIKHSEDPSLQGIQMPMRASDWGNLLLQIQPSSNQNVKWPPPLIFHNNGGFMSLSQLKYRWNPGDDGSSEPRL